MVKQCCYQDVVYVAEKNQDLLKNMEQEKC